MKQLLRAEALTGVACAARVRACFRAPLWCCCITVLLHAALYATQAADLRLRTVIYSPDEIYRLPARVGYQIDLEFEPGESFRGLGAGDIEGLAFKADLNHLFIKPKAMNVHTNLTVLTSRRVYRFEYSTVSLGSDVDEIDALYAMRFVYAVTKSSPASSSADTASSYEPQRLLAQSRKRRH